MAIEIPEQLKKEEFRFILLGEKSKVPIEKEWESVNNYKYNDEKLLLHLKNGGNYGIVCGYGNLTIVDLDNVELIDKFEKKFKDTLIIKTGSGKRHFVFKCTGLEQNYIVLKNGTGELRIQKCQVVGVNSIHPSGGIYEIINNKQIKEISKNELLKELKEYLDIEVKSYQNQLNVTKDFIENKILSKLSDTTKFLICNSIPKTDLINYKLKSRSERDQKIITTLLLQGFGSYIKSIFELYPIGDKYKEHPDGDAYLKHNIEGGRIYTGVKEDILITLEDEIINLSDRIIRNKIDYYLEQISHLKDWQYKEYLIGLIAYRTKIPKKELQKRMIDINNIRETIPPISINKLLQEAKSKPKQEYYMNNIIPKNTLILIGGKPGQFKSMFSLAVCISINNNKKFLDKFNIDQVPSILYYDLENEGIIETRASYILNGMQLSENNTIDNLHFIYVFNTNNFEYELNRCAKFDIIVLDSLRRFLKGDESNSEITNDFYRNFLTPLKKMNKTIIMLHHFRKSKTEDTGDEIELLRGSSDIAAMCDLIYGMFSTKNIDIETNNIILNIKMKILKDRLGIGIEDFKFSVEKDNINEKTTLQLEQYGKEKKPREKIMDAIVEFVKSNQNTTRAMIDENICLKFQCTKDNITKLLKTMVDDGVLHQPKHGMYETKTVTHPTSNAQLTISDI